MSMRRSSPLGHMLRSGINGVILRVLHSDLPSGWASLKSQQCMRAPFAPHPFQHWLSLVLLGLCHSDSGKRKSQVFWFAFPQQQGKATIFLKTFFNHVISSFENSLFRYQEHSFQMGGLFFEFFVLSVILCLIEFAMIISCSVGFSFTPWNISVAVQKRLSL